jgi:adenylate cyclase
MQQGYLVDAKVFEAGLSKCSVRVRIAGDRAWLNIKSARLGIERSEFEYVVPLDEARELMDQLCSGRIEKTRHLVDVDGCTFEIDEFHGDNQGLIVAELELNSTDAHVPRPRWLGHEVSQLARYYNVNLVAHPYIHWSARERDGKEDT